MADTAGRGADQDFVCITTYLPMRHWWDLVAFMRIVGRIHKQISNADGNVAWNAKGTR